MADFAACPPFKGSLETSEELVVLFSHAYPPCCYFQAGHSLNCLPELNSDTDYVQGTAL